ncbi:ABC-type transport system, involved in lipoprotein release, permease component [Peptoclostridium litorale DSM 5388]|uniref:Putative ABC transporter permease n=1 Tax=Peptoclostridium litorale DSM 5388 TaxID=1121324 RepID=A0A069REV3_PEPLI|nr:FtsX-like permease family protein [Peptoclostridium litorale]KDR94725.1 putative ABC transporter permease [Peptoclostridium litorale DSM 5388]SIO33179.1 ABC-type transport system, involved in lipoprotein release, permease component [Peptoclostridium litorale DSM 5388]
MNNSDLISMGFKNLWRRKARTILTILGVIIGTSSIVIMLSLGIAMNENFKHQLEKMGSINVIDVYSGDRYGDDDERQKKGEVQLNDDMLKQFEAISGVEVVTPVIEKYVVITAGNLQADMSIIAMDPSKMKDMGIKLAKGRFVNEHDKNALIFGAKTGENFYDPKSRDPYEDMGENNIDIMNERLKLSMDGGARESHSSAIKVDAVGVIQEGSYESDWSAYTSIETLEKMIEKNEKQMKKQSKDAEDGKENKKNRKKDKGYEKAKVKVEDIERVEEVKAVIEGMGFQARSLTEILEQMKKTSAGIQAVLGGIGAVSLFVAALGITNTMIMSIYERTREIGVMKVIGAKISDIKRLFLFEAGMIGFTGGVVGILLSYCVSLLINHVGKSLMGEFGEQASISVIPIWLVLSALVFSTFVGLASGYYPARRAMNLSALEAIKNE